MRAEKRQERMRQIEAAAYELLRDVGYEGTSMLAVAKRARASNETMYRWYGDKNGLFASMIEANAAKVRDQLVALKNQGVRPIETLDRLAPVLLEMLLSDDAIALNRAAAADPSGALGQALAEGGREIVLPLIREVMRAAIAEGRLIQAADKNMGRCFMGLLVGDQQIRRVIGVLAQPTPEEVAQQAEEALVLFLDLFGAQKQT